MLPTVDHPAHFQQDSFKDLRPRHATAGAYAVMPVMHPVRRVTARRLAARSQRVYVPGVRVQAGDPPRRVRRALPRWSCRATYLALVQSVAVTPECAQVCRRHNIAVATWVAAMTAAAIRADTASGSCRASYEAIATAIARGTKQVQRAFVVARHFGLALEVYRARELSPLERREMRQQAGTSKNLQAGTTQIWQLAWVPSATAARFSTPCPGRFTMYVSKVHLLPLGRVRGHHDLTFTHLCALKGTTEPASRARPTRKRRRADPRAVSLAADMVRRLPWLAGESLGRLAPALHRFATANTPWNAIDVIGALGDHATRTGRTLSALDTAVIRTRPAGLLAGLLRGLDEVTDYPGPAFIEELPAIAGLPVLVEHNLDQRPVLTDQRCQRCDLRRGRRRDLPLATVVCDACWHNFASRDLLEQVTRACGHPGCDTGWRTTTTGDAYPCPHCPPATRLPPQNPVTGGWVSTDGEPLF